MKIVHFSTLVSLLLDPSLGLKYETEVWQSAILVLREAKLLASLYHLAVKDDVFEQYPEYVRRHLYSAQVYAFRQYKQICYESAQLQALFTSIGVDAVFLKGANYALRGSRNSYGRICADIDILIPKAELAKCESLLKQKHWQSEKISKYDEKYYRQWAHEIPPLFHPLRGTVVDIHHNIYLPVSGRSPNIALFMQDLEILPEGTAVLAGPQTVLHSIIHLLMNEDFSSSLRDLFDIYLLLTEYADEDFWVTLTQLAKDAGFLEEFYFCLVALSTIFNIQYPLSVQRYMAGHKPSWLSTFWAKQVFIHAIIPAHPLVSRGKQKIARGLVYLRGHWIKMPLPILLTHFVVKAGIKAGDQIFGKHFLEPK